MNNTLKAPAPLLALFCTALFVSPSRGNGRIGNINLCFVDDMTFHNGAFSDDGDVVNMNALVLMPLTASGTCRVEVNGYDNSDTGPFSITLDVQ